MSAAKYIKYNQELNNLEEATLSYLPAIKDIIIKMGLEETEDLIQEGLLSVIKLLNKGVTNSSKIYTEITIAILKYVRTSFSFSGITMKSKSTEVIRTIMDSTKP